jgi:hypothetical protein
MSRLSSYSSSSSEGGPQKEVSRFDEAVRMVEFWKEIDNGIQTCIRALSASPGQVVYRTDQIRAEVRKRLLRDYLILNQEDAGYTHADFLWVYWAHLLCTGSLQHRGTTTKEFASYAFARVSLALAEFPYRKFEVDGLSLQQLRDETTVLEGDCARAVVYYCSYSSDLEPFHVSGLIQSALPVDGNEASGNGDSEFTEEEQQYMASKEFQKELLKEQQKTAQELDEEWKAELKTSRDAYAAKLSDLSSFVPEKWRDAEFVGHCCRFFCWMDTHLNLLLDSRVLFQPNQRHLALRDPVVVKAKVLKWIMTQGESAVFDNLRPLASSFLYILHSKPGARESNLRRKLGASWYSVSDWNVFVSDVDKVYAQSISVRMSDHYKKIFAEEPEDSLYRLAWYIRFFLLPMEAYSSYDLVRRGYFVFSAALMQNAKYLWSSRSGGVALRSPVIFQCLNRFWVQEALSAPVNGRTHRVWACDNVLEAMYLWVYIVFNQCNGLLDYQMPLHEKYKNIL